MTSTSIKNIFLQIPAGVRSFLIKAIAVFIGWQLLYRLLLTRINQPDFFLTNSTAWGTSSVLKMFYRNVDMIPDNFKAIILINGQKVIGIANPCNALEIFVLYFAFLYCYLYGQHHSLHHNNLAKHQPSRMGRHQPSLHIYHFGLSSGFFIMDQIHQIRF